MPRLPIFYYHTHSTVTHKYTGVHSPTHHLHRTRLVKSLPEIALMRKAGEITAKAFRQVRCTGVDLLSGCIFDCGLFNCCASFLLPPLSLSSLCKVMKATRPDMNESHLDSTFEHSVKMQGAQWMSFPPVVAGGSRANCLHYIANNRNIR